MPKYPYIADKNMYAAVMGACSWIREKGYFNKAVAYYSDRYRVDPDKLAKEIRKRQGAGQKGKGTSFKFYLVVGWEDHWCCEYDVDILYSNYYTDEWEKEKKRAWIIIKATSRKNAEKKIPNGHLDYEYHMTGACISNYEMTEHATEKEAKEYLKTHYGIDGEE